ncbi:MAG: hypothetical protein J0H74_15090 [Chitinophagaceae bacterium]|nr:hypothetical protein [Chitinophagaceae bacterium]
MITLVFAHIHRDRPPGARIFCDAELKNPSTAVKWILLPRLLLSSFLEPPTINGIRVYQWAGEGKVVCGEFDGEANVQAFCLPPHAGLVISGFPFSLFMPFNEDEICDVPYAVADDLLINGQTAESWFGSSPLCDTKATVSAVHTEAIFSRYTPERDEIPVETIGARLYTTMLRLRK